MEILISKLTARHMWAIYLIGLEKEMPEQVPKADLVQIIAVLCTELGWNEADPDAPEFEASTKENPENIEEYQDSQLIEQDVSPTGPQDLHQIHPPSADNKTQNDSIALEEIIGNHVDTMTPPASTKDSISAENTRAQEKIGFIPDLPSDLPFGCLLCDQKFSKEKYLEAHHHVKHQLNNKIDPEEFRCSHCDYKCTDPNALEQHKRTHADDKPFCCSHCEYKCSTSGNLKRHERIHTGNKPFSCSQCDYKCSTSGSLKTHERVHTGSKPFSCTQCDYKC